MFVIGAADHAAAQLLIGVRDGTAGKV